MRRIKWRTEGDDNKHHEAVVHARAAQCKMLQINETETFNSYGNIDRIGNVVEVYWTRARASNIQGDCHCCDANYVWCILCVRPNGVNVHIRSFFMRETIKCRKQTIEFCASDVKWLILSYASKRDRMDRERRNNFIFSSGLITRKSCIDKFLMKSLARPAYWIYRNSFQLKWSIFQLDNWQIWNAECESINIDKKTKCEEIIISIYGAHVFPTFSIYNSSPSSDNDDTRFLPCKWRNSAQNFRMPCHPPSLFHTQMKRSGKRIKGKRNERYCDSVFQMGRGLLVAVKCPFDLEIVCVRTSSCSQCTLHHRLCEIVLRYIQVCFFWLHHEYIQVKSSTLGSNTWTSYIMNSCICRRRPFSIILPKIWFALHQVQNCVVMKYSCVGKLNAITCHHHQKFHSWTHQVLIGLAIYVFFFFFFTWFWLSPVDH